MNEIEDKRNEDIKLLIGNSLLFKKGYEEAQEKFLDKLDKFSIPVMDEDGMKDFIEKNSDSSVFRVVNYSELKQSLLNHSPQTSQRKEGQQTDNVGREDMPNPTDADARKGKDNSFWTCSCCSRKVRPRYNNCPTCGRGKEKRQNDKNS
jgi:hypothetical protein